MAESLNSELQALRERGVVLPRNPRRAVESYQGGYDAYRQLQSLASRDLDRASTKLGRTISADNYDSPEVQKILRENAALTRAMGDKRNLSHRLQRTSSAGGGSDVFNAIPRFYDPLEYWDLSGLPWNVQDEGHRHKLHKWLRLYYATHYLIPQLVDIFTRFPLVGMNLTCKDPALARSYEDMFLNQLNYPEFLVDLGREFWCALPGEKIQGPDGIVPIEDVKSGDQVLTHTGSIKSVLGASSKNYKGGFVTLRPHYGLPMRYTYGHPFLVRRDGAVYWVPIEEIKTSDQLFVPVDGRVEEKTHVSVWETLSAEEWLPVSSSSDIDILEIPDHVVWTTSEKKYRSYVRRACTGLKPNDVWKRNTRFAQHSPLAADHKLNDDFLWFIGLYIAEGYVTKDGVQIALHAKEIDYANRVVGFAASLGLNATIRNSSENGIVVVIYSISFGAWIKSLLGTGSRDKRLPEWAMILPAERQAQILRGYFDGDGHYGEVRVFATSASIIIATQIERIIRRLGVVTTINEANSTTALGTDCQWWMVGPCLADTKFFMQMLGFESNHLERERAFAEFDDGPGYWVKVFKADHGEYEGPVYNFEVEDDHSYVGSVATHNCVGEAFPLGSFDEDLKVWEREELINPEDIVIENFSMLGSQEFKIVPPDYLKRLAQLKQPAKEYRLLEMNFGDLIPFLLKGEHIPVSGVLLRQIANKLNHWDDHGTPILLRGLRTLLHEEKLLASQDAIAERLYSPLILAKLGIQDMGDGMPPFIPGPEELDSVRDDFDIALSSDFRLMVHHFGLEVTSVFGREQMPRLGDDFDRIEKRLFQVFGMNPSLLSAGSGGQPYASSALQAEFLNQILKTFQGTLINHYKERAYVVAEAQGHYDYERKGKTRVPIYERIVQYDLEGNKQVIEVPKLLIPDMDFANFDLRDEATERQFLQSLRGLGVPIPDEKMMVGVHWDVKEMVKTYNDELKVKTIGQQQAKMDVYTALTLKGLPVPADLRAEVESVLQQSAPAGGGGGLTPGVSSPGAVPPGAGAGMGEGIVMPPAPPGLGGGPGTVAPGGGPPPITGQQPGPAGTVPQVSNERRPGLTYNTRVRVGRSALAGSPIEEFMDIHNDLGVPFMDFVADHNAQDRDDGELQDVPMEEIERLYGEWPKHAPQYREAVASEIAQGVLDLQENQESATIEFDDIGTFELAPNQELREGRTEDGHGEDGEWIFEKKKVSRIDLILPEGVSKYSIVDPEAQPIEDNGENSEEQSE